MRRVIPLPPEEAAFISPDSTTPPLLRRERAVALVRAGWSYTAVSTALGHPRSTLQHWVDRDPPSTEPVPQPPPAAPKRPAASRPPLPPIPPADAEALAALMPIASRYRRGASASTLQAAQICDEIVLRLSAQGYSPTQIAREAGLDHAAVKSRLQTAKRKARRA